MHRREFLQRAGIFTTALTLDGPALFASSPSRAPLQQFGYSDIALSGDPFEQQFANTHAVLMSLDEDALMKPFREMSGKPAPGDDLGGWYMYKPDYDYRKDSAGLCPGGTFGQWISALSRYCAITGDPATREKVLRLNQIYAQSLGSGFFDKNRFPAYCYDKLVCGLIDAHEFAKDPNALAILNQTTDTVLPYLPPHAVDREQSWRTGKGNDISYNWDESYTLPENLFIAYQRGAGDRYRQLAIRYLDDSTYFDPLANNINVLPGKHAYSYVNALNSAMQAYLTLDSDKHLQAAKNAFEMLVTTQSYATGGWGPDELLRPPGAGALASSLVDQHKSFETPCGAYAHTKLSRYLLRVTRQTRYGDSMELVLYNTVLGAKPLQPDGTAFYYSDYSYQGHKGYSNHRWPCCSGTLPQIAADYRICSYFHDEHDLFVNLYAPSALHWNRQGSSITVQQDTRYPFEDKIRFLLTLSRPSEFSLYLRVPAWSPGASVAVNGKPATVKLTPNHFLPLRRTWNSGDRIELRLPMTTRLQPIDPQHSDVVALLFGPLVLFPVTAASPAVTRQELLSAQRAAERTWQVRTTSATFALLPFMDISNEPYTTYVRVSG